MLVKIVTKFTLDPSQPLGKKNLDLLIIAAGLRSQVEVRSISANRKNWVLVLFLERPEFWGSHLEFLQQDLEGLMIFHHDKPTPARRLLDFGEISINSTDTFGDIDHDPSCHN
jgi:hypothetical protein